MKPAILVTSVAIAPEARAMLGDFELAFTSKAPDEAELVALARRHRPVAIIVRAGRITPAVIDACGPGLRVISKHGAGIDTIDVAAARARGIEVRAALGANADSVAEHTWALILACAKGVAHLDARMRQGHWDKVAHRSLELRGKTLGIVGLGAIGRRVAAMARGFAMTAVAFDPYAKDVPEGVRLVTLDELLAQSHVVTLNCPLTDENRNLVNAGTIAKMREGAIVVNTGRGGLVDAEALIAALMSGRLRAAGLDAFADEPLEGAHPFAEVPNVVLTPHVGGNSEQAMVNMGTGAAANVLAVLAPA